MRHSVDTVTESLPRIEAITQTHTCIHVLTHLTLHLHLRLRPLPLQTEPVLSPSRDGSRRGFSSGQARQKEEAVEG